LPSAASHGSAISWRLALVDGHRDDADDAGDEMRMTLDRAI
jgi:hypothetical protein